MCFASQNENFIITKTQQRNEVDKLKNSQSRPYMGGGRHCTAVAFALTTQPARVPFLAFPVLLGFNDSKSTAYTVDSARGLIVIQTHLVLASGKLVLQKK